MNIDLPDVNESDSLAHLIEKLGRDLSEEDLSGLDADWYSRIRAILRGHPAFKGRLPEFLIQCKTSEQLVEFRSNLPDYDWMSRVNKAVEGLKTRAACDAALDNYDIENKIGRGGYGVVYKAFHRFSGRPIALKFFSPMFHEGGGSAVGRFFQEATMLFDLKHRYIPTARDLGVFRERPFIAMDFFEGNSLYQVLGELGNMPLDKSISMVKMLLSALSHAHENGILHRDLRPANILLAHGELRVIDFGLGYFVERSLESRFTGCNDRPVGSGFVCSQLARDPINESKPRSDIFSIGAVWYYALTQHEPTGAGIETMLDEVDGLTPSLRSVILKSLSSPELRYQNCVEMLSGLEEAISESAC